MAKTKYIYHEDAMHGYDIAIGSKLIDELIEKRIEFINKYIDIIWRNTKLYKKESKEVSKYEWK